MLTNINQIDPQVRTAIARIIANMTNIHVTQQMNPLVGSHNESEPVKAMKRECVHIIQNGNDYRPSISPRTDGTTRCDMCDRVIYQKFDDTAVKRLQDALEVINQMTIYGLMFDIGPGPLQTLLSMKVAMPGVIQCMHDLNVFAKMEEQSMASTNNIGGEYPSMDVLRGITGQTGTGLF